MFVETHYGMSRTVFLIGPIVIKVPSFRHGMLYWLYGLVGNVLEHQRWMQLRHPQLGRVYWTGPLGLFLIMRRYWLLDRCLSKEELATIPFDVDNNECNVGYDAGHFVLVDYGSVFWAIHTPDGI